MKKVICFFILVFFGFTIIVSAQENQNKHKPNKGFFDDNRKPFDDSGRIQPPPPPPPVLPGIPGLSKEQSESIHKLQIGFAKSIFPLENSIGEKEAKLKTISTTDNPDINGIYKIIDEIGGLKIQIAKLKASHDQDIRKLLNDEQRLAFDHRPCLLP
jgi:hypothetical protein